MQLVSTIYFITHISNRMPLLVPIPGTHPSLGNNLWRIDSLCSLSICNSYQGVLLHILFRFWLSHEHTWTDLWTMPRSHYVAASASTLYLGSCQGSQLILALIVPNHITYSIYHLGYDGCTICHLHSIKCMNNTQNYTEAWSQFSTTGQG